MRTVNPNRPAAKDVTVVPRTEKKLTAQERERQHVDQALAKLRGLRISLQDRRVEGLDADQLEQVALDAVDAGQAALAKLAMARRIRDEATS